MLSAESIEYTKSDVLKTTVVSVVAHVIRQTMQEKELFANEWLISTGGLIVGVAVHGLVMRSLNKMVNLSEPYKTGVADSIRLVTMLLVQKVVKDLVNKGTIVTENIGSWMKNLGLMVAGILIYDMLFGMIMPKFVQDRKELTDTIKLSLPLVVADFVPDFDLDHDTLKTGLATFSGVATYHMLMQN